MIPKGGTELLRGELLSRIDKSILDEVQIVTRPNELDSKKKKNILWVHDLPADIEFLGKPANRLLFDGIVFVSSWQQQIFNFNMNVSFAESVVIKNAINPIPYTEKPNDGTIRLIYHPTPHRGLQLLVPAFMELCNRYENLHLDVFSNFDLYARPEMNKDYEQIYDICKSHDKITYHGSANNSTVRNALVNADIFAYPCIWRETSCLSAMEAMSARCLIVAPNYGALAETMAGYNMSYDWTENPREHVQRFIATMDTAIQSIRTQQTCDHIDEQKQYVDKFYNWDTRILRWEEYLESVVRKEKQNRSFLTWN